MKTKEQIELAEFLNNELQDYITLAKAQKKLKHESRVDTIGKLIDSAQDTINAQVKNL